MQGTQSSLAPCSSVWQPSRSAVRRSPPLARPTISPLRVQLAVRWFRDANQRPYTLAPVTVPEFQTIMRPTLAALADGEPRSIQSIRSVVAEALGVSEEDQAELLASGKQTRYSNRVAWALTHMAKAGLIERPGPGAVRDFAAWQAGLGTES